MTSNKIFIFGLMFQFFGTSIDNKLLRKQLLVSNKKQSTFILTNYTSGSGISLKEHSMIFPDTVINSLVTHSFKTYITITIRLYKEICKTTKTNTNNTI